MTDPRSRPWLFPGLVAIALAIAAGSMLVGAGDLADPAMRSTFLELRAHRLAAGFLAGAALAVGGVLVQGLFRNPLASPYILGTSSGANLGGQLALLFFQVLLVERLPASFVPEMFLPIGCLAGAGFALALLLTITRGRVDLVLVLLTGFILSSLFVSLGAFVTSLAQNSFELGRAMVYFSLGGLDGAGQRHVALALPLVGAGTLAAWLWGRPLDLLLSGEDEAQSLGVDVVSVRRWAVVWTAVLTGAAVAVGGNVGFVGLVVPHALRPFVGADHRRLVPAVFLAGGSFVVACDVVTRVAPTQATMPLGVVTGLIGAPVFLTLLVRSRREGML